MRRVSGILLAAALCAPGSALAAPPRAEDAAQYFRAIRAARRQGPVDLDGRPDEPAWLAAEPGTGFTQFSPDEGAAPSVQTRFRVLWDDDAIWVGVECDDPLPPTALLSRRDRPVDGDYISFDLDTTNDRRTAYHFQVFAGGQQLDALHFNDTDFTADWDAAWESAVAVSDRGWSVEVRIPLRILRIPEGARSFGFNIYRILARRHEEDQWRYRPHGAAGDISMLGELTGLAGIRPVRSLELRPYFATRSATTRPAPADATAPLIFDPCLTVGYTTRSVAGACVGLDLRYSIASDVSLVGTLNPDFGQVEADQRVLNLSTFETFFPEKRPFFTEGLDLFQSPLRINFGGPYGGDAYQIFYSRRIGRPPPTWSDWDGDKGILVYQPAARPVLAAWKLTGTAGPSSFGLLTSYEPRVEAQSVLQGGNHSSDVRVAEAVHSAALRVRTPITSRALLGVFATAVDPIGVSPSLALPGNRHAHVAGADFVTYDAARDWSFTTQGTGSFLSGGTPDVQPDGTVLASGSSGAAASAKIAKDAGPLVGFAGGDWLSPRFTVNDLGFMRRANLLRGFGYLQLRDVHPNSVWQRAFVGAWAREVRNAQGELALDRDTGFETFVLLNSQWSFGHAFLLQLPYVDDRELGDGTPLERQRAWVFNPFFNSDSRKAVSYGGYMDYGRSAPRYERLYDFGATLNVRPLPQLETNLELSFVRSDGTIRQIRTASEVPSCGASCGAPPAPLDPATATQHDRLYILAPQSSRSVSLTGRGTYAFSPRLTLQLYAQLFGAGISYGSPLRAFAPPGKATVRFSDLVPARPEDVPPDGDDRQAGLNVNLILRWEWRLGSTLYLVYAHQSSTDFVPSRRGLDFGGELSAFGARGAVHGDTFLVKVDLFEAL